MIKIVGKYAIWVGSVNWYTFLEGLLSIKFEDKFGSNEDPTSSLIGNSYVSKECRYKDVHCIIV